MLRVVAEVPQLNSWLDLEGVVLFQTKLGFPLVVLAARDMPKLEMEVWRIQDLVEVDVEWFSQEHSIIVPLDPAQMAL
jgi:hypothetical protein